MDLGVRPLRHRRDSVPHLHTRLPLLHNTTTHGHRVFHGGHRIPQFHKLSVVFMFQAERTPPVEEVLLQLPQVLLPLLELRQGLCASVTDRHTLHPFFHGGNLSASIAHQQIDFPEVPLHLLFLFLHLFFVFGAPLHQDAAHVCRTHGVVHILQAGKKA